MNGSVNLEQQKAILPFVRGKEVLDLGAHDMILSGFLGKCGAERVVAVDRTLVGDPPPGVEAVECHFHNLSKRAPVAFVSWPVNWHSDIVPILVDAKTVIYLGKNTDGTACGDPNFWSYLRTREVLAYVPDRRNTLTVYGPKTVDREPTGEERAAASTLVPLMYDAVENPL